MPADQTEAPERFGDAGRLAGDPATLNLTGKAGNLCSVSVTLKAQSGRTLREPPMMPPCWIEPPGRLAEHEFARARQHSPRVITWRPAKHRCQASHQVCTTEPLEEDPTQHLKPENKLDFLERLARDPAPLNRTCKTGE